MGIKSSNGYRTMSSLCDQLFGVKTLKEADEFIRAFQEFELVLCGGVESDPEVFQKSRYLLRRFFGVILESGNNQDINRFIYTNIFGVDYE